MKHLITILLGLFIFNRNLELMTVTNLNVTGEELSNYIKTNKLHLTNNMRDTHDTHNTHDSQNTFNELNNKIIDLSNRISKIEKKLFQT
mgnify:CR=1 FL=1